MCLGEYGTVVAVVDTGRAVVRAGGHDRVVSLAVLVAEGETVGVGDVVVVSMGMALRVVDDPLTERAAGIVQEVNR